MKTLTLEEIIGKVYRFGESSDASLYLQLTVEIPAFLATERRKAIEEFVLYCRTNDDAVERITDYGANQLIGILETYLKESEAENETKN